MARNVNEIEADEAGQRGHVMESDTFLSILQDVNALKAKGKKVLGDTSAKLAKAESDHNLDKKAFAVVASCTRMEPSRLNGFLRHLDAYREYADLDGMAGADMFEGETKPKKARGRPKKEAVLVATNGSGKKPDKAPKKPGSGKPRGRPPGSKKKAPEADTAVEAAAKAWGLSHESETAGQG